MHLKLNIMTTVRTVALGLDQRLHSTEQILVDHILLLVVFISLHCCLICMTFAWSAFVRSRNNRICFNVCLTAGMDLICLEAVTLTAVIKNIVPYCRFTNTLSVRFLALHAICYVNHACGVLHTVFA